MCLFPALFHAYVERRQDAPTDAPGQGVFDVENPADTTPVQNTTTTTNTDNTFDLMRLPFELRERIYHFATEDYSTNIVVRSNQIAKFFPPIAHTNRQILQESLPVFFRKAMFKIDHLSRYSFFTSILTNTSPGISYFPFIRRLTITLVNFGTAAIHFLRQCTGLHHLTLLFDTRAFDDEAHTSFIIIQGTDTDTTMRGDYPIQQRLTELLFPDAKSGEEAPRHLRRIDFLLPRRRIMGEEAGALQDFKAWWRRRVQGERVGWRFRIMHVL